ncbi:hypothetical protein [Marinospirillum sp.]|nr:hypothetical protein [Marinospirillum sp.]MDR9468447.1 hypothetical protein [Marinospirillum sp.]
MEIKSILPGAEEAANRAFAYLSLLLTLKIMAAVQACTLPWL